MSISKSSQSFIATHPPLPNLQGRRNKDVCLRGIFSGSVTFVTTMWASFFLSFLPTRQGHMRHLHFMELFLRRKFWFILMCMYTLLCLVLFFLTCPEYSAPSSGKVNKFIQITWELIWNGLHRGNDSLRIECVDSDIINPHVDVLEASFSRLLQLSDMSVWTTKEIHKSIVVYSLYNKCTTAFVPKHLSLVSSCIWRAFPVVSYPYLETFFTQNPNPVPTCIIRE